MIHCVIFLGQSFENYHLILCWRLFTFTRWFVQLLRFYNILLFKILPNVDCTHHITSPKNDYKQYFQMMIDNNHNDITTWHHQKTRQGSDTNFLKILILQFRFDPSKFIFNIIISIIAYSYHFKFNFNVMFEIYHFNIMLYMQSFLSKFTLSLVNQN